MRRNKRGRIQIARCPTRKILATFIILAAEVKTLCRCPLPLVELLS